MREAKLYLLIEISMLILCIIVTIVYNNVAIAFIMGMVFGQWIKSLIKTIQLYRLMRGRRK